ncbi:helicase-related protein [Aerococcus vaginalis]
MVFLPTVKRMVQLENIVRNVFPNAHFKAVHASDDERLGKVQAMRDTAVQFLLTTTILERGVTFEAIDVIVLGSEHRAFTTSALVQIAGRVGRKAWAPNGEVIFIHAGRTKASVDAVREIQRMNRLGRLRGLLDEVTP